MGFLGDFIKQPAAKKVNRVETYWGIETERQGKPACVHQGGQLNLSILKEITEFWVSSSGRQIPMLCPRYAAIPQGMLRTTQREVATFLFSSKEQPCLWYFFFHCITHCHICFDIWAGKIRLISIVVLYLNRTAMQIILVERSIRRLSA